MTVARKIVAYRYMIHHSVLLSNDPCNNGSRSPTFRSYRTWPFLNVLVRISGQENNRRFSSREDVFSLWLSQWRSTIFAIMSAEPKEVE